VEQSNSGEAADNDDNSEARNTKKKLEKLLN